ncbi:MAG: hypothetical protein V3S24_22155 [Candidatus Tectomicrobia bacterium]
MSQTPWCLWAPAPLLGQHNGEVLGGLLGLSAEDMAEFSARGITGRTPARKR